MNKLKGLIIFWVLIALVGLGAFVYAVKNEMADSKGDIGSYEDCIEAGYPMMKSYPPKCATPDGRVFVQELPPLETSEMKAYTDPSGSVSLSYPSFAEARQAPVSYVQDWKAGATGATGSLLADVRIPRSYMQGTNFSDARFTIGRSADPVEIKNCTVVQDNFSERSDADIDGYPFIKMAFADAGAGNFYETTSYRGIFDGDCYVVEYTIHSTNIGNYPAELGIREFDKGKLTGLLEEMVESVEFLISSD